MEVSDAMAVGGDDGVGECAGLWIDREILKTSGFLEFLRQHEIDLLHLIPPAAQSEQGEQRFVRLKRAADANDEASQLERVKQSLVDAGFPDVAPVPASWVPGFYSLPASVPLSRLTAYKNGLMYGIDISSGYAVTLLHIQQGEHVLDLCCAPGAKLTMMADLLEMNGSVTGVDYSRSRIAACKQLIHKYQLIRQPCDSAETSSAWRCRLFHADGRTFNVGPKTECARVEGIETILDTNAIATRSVQGQKRKRENKSARAREAKQPKVWNFDAALFDKVLVDAECTHDGSIKHLQKMKTLEEWTKYVDEHLNDKELDRILQLQKDLIRNGFKMLKPGGTMIYSTCSLSVKQNEHIVEAFLRDHPTASLIPVVTTDIPCESGRIPGTLRFTPSNNTSGLFIAKISKSKKNDDVPLEEVKADPVVDEPDAKKPRDKIKAT
ncbi:TPA: hypothetical protein N0F65_008386 [Lagenidium giganteum]|uniref:SAM-dependent MTase RsmB/NOP-type domain-containing protein n=1 Tax=Lagenidium giganteum TaxID=4803 RepID=A0AAV2Z0T2_9STRA|nr:TPA: hypothetical protein N0F65_008386 [Lagenidium giganteum]